MRKARKGKKPALILGAAVLLGVAATGLFCRRELRSWYVLATSFERLARNAQGYPEYRHRQTGIIFVRVPAGKFLMGSPETEEGRNPDEGPVHEVELSSFLMAKYELTQGEWEKVIGSNPSGFNSKNRGGQNHPVEAGVTWYDADHFCKKVGLKLPTEAQWEYACRGPETAKGGAGFAESGQIGDMAWHNENSGLNTHPVGEKRANGFGMHDMQGNVWEWCEDVYVEKFYETNSAKNKDPVNASGSGLRVLRGGGWRSDSKFCRSASRCGTDPGGHGDNLGFRVAFYPLP